MQPPANHGHNIVAPAPSGARNAAADPPRRFQARSMQRTESNMPNLHVYRTGDIIREATREEWTASTEAERTNGTGAFLLNGATVYVEGGYPPSHADIIEAAIKRAEAHAEDAEGAAAIAVGALADVETELAAVGVAAEAVDHEAKAERWRKIAAVLRERL